VRFPACGVAGLGAAHIRGEVDLRRVVREASVRARGKEENPRKKNE
jgi:hypothetical protein